MKNKNIVFFDGYCALCNGFVDFLMRMDKKGVLFFAPLQGKTAADILAPEYSSTMGTVVFIKGGKGGPVFIKAEALIQILGSLGPMGKIIGRMFGFVPGFLRDFFYDIIAGNRYKWFVRRETCRLPAKGELKRILP